jgi:hypothetical protein
MLFETEIESVVDVEIASSFWELVCRNKMGWSSENDNERRSTIRV